MFDVGCDFGIDKAEFTGCIFVDRDETEELDGWDTERTDCIPDADSFDRNFWASEFTLYQLSAVHK